MKMKKNLDLQCKHPLYCIAKRFMQKKIINIVKAAPVTHVIAVKTVKVELNVN